jgi:hypothetical protein
MKTFLSLLNKNLRALFCISSANWAMEFFGFRPAIWYIHHLTTDPKLYFWHVNRRVKNTKRKIASHLDAPLHPLFVDNWYSYHTYEVPFHIFIQLNLSVNQSQLDCGSILCKFCYKDLKIHCKIWGFHGGDYEEWCLLGCYAVWLL